jgi:hypothetical protein
VQQDQDIQASFSGNHIWLFAQNFSLQTVTTTINDALTQAASSSHDALIRIENGAYFEGSGTGVKCDSDFGGTVPVFSGGWATSLTASSKPTVISPKLTISGAVRLRSMR